MALHFQYFRFDRDEEQEEKESVREKVRLISRKKGKGEKEKERNKKTSYHPGKPGGGSDSLSRITKKSSISGTAHICGLVVRLPSSRYLDVLTGTLNGGP